jgi:hypothetical protein
MSPIEEQARAAAMLLAELRNAHPLDEEDVQTAIEGQTDLIEVARQVLVEMQEAADHVRAIGDTIMRLRARSDRIERREQRLREALLGAMEMAGLRSLRLPESTLTVTVGRPSVRVIDEAQIPADFWRVEEVRKLDRKRILSDLLGNEAVPGAALSNGASCLTVRNA